MSSPSFSSLSPEGSKNTFQPHTSSSTSTTTTHSHTRKPSASNPIVRPGPNAEGPKGFSERLNAAEESPKSHASSGATGGGGIKDKMRKVGEKLALVQPRDTENLSTEREEAARQNASTMPE